MNWFKSIFLGVKKPCPGQQSEATPPIPEPAQPGRILSPKRTSPATPPQSKTVMQTPQSALEALVREEREFKQGLCDVEVLLHKAPSYSRDLLSGEYPNINSASTARTKQLDRLVWFTVTNVKFLQVAAVEHTNARHSYKLCNENSRKIAQMLNLPEPTVMNGGCQIIWQFCADYMQLHQLTSYYTP